MAYSLTLPYRKIFGLTVIASLAIALTWWLIFSLKPYAMSADQMRAAYDYQTPSDIGMKIERVDDRSATFIYQSFDGSQVNGRIHYPRPFVAGDAPFPVMIGIHAMGRSEARWWKDSVNGSPTIELTHRLSQFALNQGYAVITIDARLHGSRKNPNRTLKSLMSDLHYFGDRTDYEHMIRDTVRDHRVMLDWIQTNPQLDPSRIQVAGYSMGAQIALLLAGLDQRVSAVLAIAPPHIGSGTALVAPQNVIAGLAGKQVWMLSGSDDEHASISQNLVLFDSLPGDPLSKRHLIYQGGHILPDDYLGDLAEWFQRGQSLPL